MTLFGTSIKRRDIGDFCQKMSILLDAGYDTCSAVELLAAKPEDKRRMDRSADGIRKVAELLLPDLKEGYSLHEAMATHDKYFAEWVNEVEVGESSGKSGEVLGRIYDQIKNASKIMGKLRSAMAYPVITLVLTFGVAAYLFTSVMPDMLQMLADVGSTEIPASTQLVMSVGSWFGTYGAFLALILLGIAMGLMIYGQTVGKEVVSKVFTELPFIGRIIQNNSMTLFYRNWQQMILAGAEMSVALESAAAAIKNRYMRNLLADCQTDYAENGIPVYQALRAAPVVRELELQTIQVAMEGNNLAKTLGILSNDREFEATRAINTLTAALNPLMMIIVGIVVGVLVMSIYGPIISVSSSLG